MEKTEYLPIDQIEASARTQVRVRLDPGTIDEYANDMLNNAIFPPITVFAEEGSGRYILADGFHRLAAATKAKLMEIECEIRVGGPKEALTYALGANSDNGLRRSNADKRHAVLMALDNPAFDKLALRSLAELCHVSHVLVMNIKEEQVEKAAAKKNGKKPADKKKAKDKTKATPAISQAAAAKVELMDAVHTFRSFPYDGKEAVIRMGLTVEDVTDLAYCFEWLYEALGKLDPDEYGEGE